MTRVVFEEVSFTARRAFKCKKCGRRCKRTRKFWQTLNPFNVDKKTKLPKTRGEIMAEIQKQVRAFQPDSCGCGDS